jgi:hypothetical protein
MTNNQLPITNAPVVRSVTGHWLLVIGYSLFEALAARNLALRGPLE